MENENSPPGGLLERIQRYLDVTGITDMTFGQKAAGNVNAVKRLRAGKGLHSNTIGKIEAFLAQEADRGRRLAEACAAPPPQEGP